MDSSWWFTLVNLAVAFWIAVLIGVGFLQQKEIQALKEHISNCPTCAPTEPEEIPTPLPEPILDLGEVYWERSI